jgi:hypothetical protein
VAEIAYDKGYLFIDSRCPLFRGLPKLVHVKRCAARCERFPTNHSQQSLREISWKGPREYISIDNAQH